ncbi:MAG TPA: HYR domain-containing protein [Thermoanaerobaculia bacterium]|nr:HYR domain-containing protein [Thermoanaerobaculia bacterium]
MARETPTISAITPNAVHTMSGEWFMTIQGTHFLPTSGVNIVFNGPAGVFTLTPSAATDTTMSVWVPLEIVNIPGYYSVIVRASHAIDSNSATLQVIGPTIFLQIPSIVLAEAMSFDGGIARFDVTATSLYSAAITIDCSHKSGEFFAFTSTTVDCVATDDLGNAAKDSFSVRVADNTPPAITTPTDLLWFGKPDGSLVTFDVKSTDLVDPDTKPLCKPESGSFFRIGTSSITCTSSDRFGNTGSQDFRVHVGSDDTPALVAPASVFAEATGRDGATVTYKATGSNVKGSGVDVLCDPAAGKLFPIGVTPVKCTAFGSNGASIMELFNITVGDTTAPTLVLPGDISAQAPSADGAFVRYSASGKDAVDGETLATCYPESGSLFAAGTTTVHCSSTDSTRNTSNGTFIVTVTPWFDPVEQP